MNARQPVTSGNGKTVTLDKMLAELAQKREIPVHITPRDYAESVVTLISLARKYCGGSKAAAQVVLGLYNGRNWHVDLIDLCNLDAENYRAAMIAIRGRVEFNREPHELINDGDRIFEELQDQWQHLHTNTRYKNY